MFGMSNVRVIWMAAVVICIFSLFTLAYQTRINENANDTMFENFIHSFLWFSGSITLYVVFPVGMICGIIDYTSNNHGGHGGTGGLGMPGMGKFGALAGVGMAGMAAYAAKEKLKAAAGAAKDKVKGAAGAVGRGASAAAGKVKGAAGKVGSKVKGVFSRR